MILLIFPGIIGIIVCTIILIVQAIMKKKNTKTLIALVCFFIMCGVALSSLDSDEEDEETTQTTSVVAESTIASESTTEPPTEPSTDSTTEPTEEATTEKITEPTEETLTIELIAGEPGEYGELFTINKGTEFEETYYIYHIPAGTYTVTNIGEHMNQFNVYSDEVHIVDGWEEPAEVIYVKLLDVNESDTFTIQDGQYIEIHGPGGFRLEKVGK